MRPHHFRAYNPAGSVIVSVALPASGPARIDSGDQPVDYVVFYDEAEVVVGRQAYEHPPQGRCCIDWEGDE